MTPDELKEINNIENVITFDEIIEALNVTDDFEGTLLYGFNLDRFTFHVYIKNKMIHILLYSLDLIVFHKVSHAFAAHHYNPVKRAYPDQTLFGFAKLLKSRGEYITYTVSSRRCELEVGKFTKGSCIADTQNNLLYI